MNQSRSQLIKVASTLRPKFSDLPDPGSSGWFGLYIAYDPELELIGINDVNLSIKSTNKKIRFNAQQVLKRESGTYTVLSGCGDLEPFGRRTRKWKFGPEALAGLPIVAIKPDESAFRTEPTELRAVMLMQLQLERTNVSTQSTSAPEPSSEAMEIDAHVRSLLTGDLERSMAQGDLYIVPIPPPDDMAGTSGDFKPVQHVVVQSATMKDKVAVSFPNSHFAQGPSVPFLCYCDDQSNQTLIPDLNKPELYGDYFKLPFPIPFGYWDETGAGKVGPPTVMCQYGRIGKLVASVNPNFPEGSYVMVPQPISVVSPDKATSVQIKAYSQVEWNDAVDVAVYTPNSLFTFEGGNPTATSADTVVDGVSITQKGKGNVGYKIWRFTDRTLKTGKSTRIPMPDPNAKDFLGGMPLEFCTPYGISNTVLIRNSIQLRSWWKDLCRAVIAVSKVVLDVALEIDKVLGDEQAGPYAKQYAELTRLSHLRASSGTMARTRPAPAA